MSQKRSGTIQYLLNKIKYEHDDKCRNELGLVGGSNVSHIKGNLVDLESDLRGQTRNHSKCSLKKFQPIQNNTIEFISNETNKKITVDTNLVHLPNCQIIDYKSVATPFELQKECPPPNRITK